MRLLIEPLDSQPGRDRFDCGDPALNAFLATLAGQQQRKGLGRTYLALRPGEEGILGFVTLSAGQVSATPLPTRHKLPHYPIPVLRMGHLAVDLRHQGLGVGRDLLAFALHLARDFSERVGLYAVVVDAKNERAGAFYRQLGSSPHWTMNGACTCPWRPCARLPRDRASPRRIGTRIVWMGWFSVKVLHLSGT